MNKLDYVKSKRRFFTVQYLSILLLTFTVIHAKNVSATTLNEALIYTYLNNPTLNAQRATLRAADEEISRAISGFRPTITATGDASYNDTNGVKSRPYGYSIALTQPVFRGLRTINTVRTADANILAENEVLRNTEQTVFLETVTAFMDVVRDQAIVRLRKNNVKVLREQARATKERFDVGAVTKTDVAQSEARLSGALSQFSSAKADLEASKATYQRVVGKKAGFLLNPGYIRKYIPKKLNLAIQIGEAEVPNVLQTIYLEQASYHNIKIITGELLPEANVQASYSQRFGLSSSTTISSDETETKTVTGNLSVPIYQAGEVSARIRQAKQTNIQRKHQVTEAKLQAKADIISSWGRLVAARAQLKSQNEQVRASNTALNGVREEEKVGLRTVLDVLDAEQELLDAQVNLTTTKRDLVVAGYTLLSSIGRLSASNLGLSVPIYDSRKYYESVKYKLFGLGRSHKNDKNIK